MKDQRFGIEIEMTGITREKAARTLAEHLGAGGAYYAGGAYKKWTVKDQQGRTWNFVSDASISTDGGEQVELVSPILTYEDIPSLQEAARKLRKAGAKVNTSCGIHIHIDAAVHTAQSLRNLSNIIASKEDLLYEALNVHAGRLHHCKKVKPGFTQELNQKKPKTLDALSTIWYKDTTSGAHYHYNETRYHGLNIHNVWFRGTVEFRFFNSTLHAGEIKTYIQLALAISHQARTQRSATPKATTTTNAKFTFRTWLLRLGLIGEEFETCRHHLLKHLTGDAAWRHGDPHTR